MPIVERMSERGGWAWLAFAGLVHVAWIAMCLWAVRRTRGARAVITLFEGRAHLDGLVATDGVVHVGEAFALVLPSGEEVQVQRDGRARRAWEIRPQFAAGDAVSVEGELARRLMEGDETYRASSIRWTLRARSVRRIAEADPVARTRRRANLALWAGALGVVVHCVASAEFLMLSLWGEVADAVVELSVERHRGAAAGGSVRIMEATLLAEARVDGPDGSWTVVEEVPTDPRWLSITTTEVMPVVVTSVGGVRFAQIRPEPGLARTVPYAGLAELMASVFALMVLRRDWFLVGPRAASG